MLENATNLSNTTNVTSTLNGFINAMLHYKEFWPVIVPIILFILKVGYDIMYKNYPQRKKEHIDELSNNVLKRWETVKCELSPTFGLDKKFVLLKNYSPLTKYRDFDFAVAHIKSYPCWLVWERILESVRSLNTSASAIIYDLNREIDKRIKSEFAASSITISPIGVILDQIVQILIADSDRKRRCDGHITVEKPEKWVQVKETGSILAEGGGVGDLDAFKRVICGWLLNGYCKKLMNPLLKQFEDIKIDVEKFRKELRDISLIAEQRQKLKGTCKGCPRFLWFFSP